MMMRSPEMSWERAIRFMCDGRSEDRPDGPTTSSCEAACQVIWCQRRDNTKLSMTSGGSKLKIVCPNSDEVETNH
jgi:hypothetical protein